MAGTLVVKLSTEILPFGNSAPKLQNIKSTAANKFKALSQKAKDAAINKEQQKEDESQNMKPTRDPFDLTDHSIEYGKGQNHSVQRLLAVRFETLDELEKYTTQISNQTSAFEALSSFDVKSAKHAYLSKRQEIIENYAETYGSDVAAAPRAQMLEEMSRYSFYYSRSQIIIIVRSDEPIPGADFDDKTKVYTLILKTKTIYKQGKTVLNPTELQKIMGMPTDRLVVSKGIKPITVQIQRDAHGIYHLVYDKSIISTVSRSRYNSYLE